MFIEDPIPGPVHEGGRHENDHTDLSLDGAFQVSQRTTGLGRQERPPAPPLFTQTHQPCFGGNATTPGPFETLPGAGCIGWLRLLKPGALMAALLFPPAKAFDRYRSHSALTKKP
jgi:hypothetical protein